jgi:hypothetical protein
MGVLPKKEDVWGGPSSYQPGSSQTCWGRHCGHPDPQSRDRSRRKERACNISTHVCVSGRGFIQVLPIKRGRLLANRKKKSSRKMFSLTLFGLAAINEHYNNDSTHSDEHPGPPEDYTGGVGVSASQLSRKSLQKRGTHRSTRE